MDTINVLNFATECHDKNHCATYPIELPDWFIRLFSACGDVVLDPFLGSGTTAIAAMKNERRFIGIDKEPKFCGIAKKRIDSYFQAESCKE